MEAEKSSEALVSYHKTPGLYNPEDLELNIHWRKNLRCKYLLKNYAVRN
jgi:hypothetical protein